MNQPFEVVWAPSPDRAAALRTTDFMAIHGVADFDELRRRSVADPDWFWSAVVDFLELPFDRPWRAVSDTSRGEPWTTWFAGSTFNLSRACVDRWAESDPSRVAVRSQREDGTIEQLDFGQLRDEVATAAGGLRDDRRRSAP